VGTIANIIARLKGKGDGKAILVIGHYDTVPSSPGAADNGYSVAAMLETLRRLRAGGPLDNDVITLFSDGEELGLLGARALFTSILGVKMSVSSSTLMRAEQRPILCLKRADRMDGASDNSAKADPFR